MGEFRYVGTQFLENRAMAALAKATVECAHDLVGKAQGVTPVDTGTLKASIHVEDVKVTARTVRARVATGGEANAYAIYIHEGTSPHLIRARDGGVLAFDGHFAKQVHHPGTRAYKYLEGPLIAERGTYIAFIEAATRAAF